MKNINEYCDQISLNEYLSTKVKVDEIDNIENLSMEDFKKLLSGLKFEERDQGQSSIHGNVHTALEYKSKSFMAIFWEDKYRSFNNRDKAYDILFSDGKDYVCNMWYDDNGNYIKDASFQQGFYKTTGYYGGYYKGPRTSQYGENAIVEIKKFLYDQK
jgi:hypothetical protein